VSDAPREHAAPSPRLSLRQLLSAVVLVAVAAAVLGGAQELIGPNTATSGYLTILFLLSVVRGSSWRTRILSTVWSFAVALLGFTVGGLGLWVTLIALVVVSLLQGFVTVGETVLLTRSPVNLLAFAALAQGGAELWHVLLGSVIGAAVIWAFAAIARERHVPLPHGTSTAERIGYGIATAAGSVLIVAAGNAIGFLHLGWALLSFCIILSVGADERAARGFLRVVWSVVGAILAMLVSLLPAPIPTIAAAACAVLCVAYVSAGNYAYFMLFLTPTILLTTATEHSMLVLGLLRLEALGVATVLALLSGFLITAVIARVRRARPGDVA